MIGEQDVFDPENPDNPLHLIQKHAPDTSVAPAHGIAAIALGMALRYHDINTVQDGVLYQQYKMEGRNMRELQLDNVLETAVRMEMHLIASSKRISNMIIEALTFAVDDGADAQDKTDDGKPDQETQQQTP